MQSSEQSDTFDVTKFVGHRMTDLNVTITNNDAILYALSIGFNQDPLNRDHYKFTFENDSDFQTFPTHSVVLLHR